MAFSAQAQTTDICDRTPAVVDEILRLTDTVGDTCESVSVSEMAGIRNFDLFLLNDKGLTSLRSGDFDGLTNLQVLILNDNDLTELPAGFFTSLPKLNTLSLSNNAFTIFPFGSGLANISTIHLNGNRLDTLPSSAFLGFSKLTVLSLQDNPGAPFRLTVRFEPETLEEDFDAAPVRIALREGAPRTITAPLSVTGGSLIDGSPDSLTIARGSTQSDSVTVIRGDGYFRLAQGELELLGADDSYMGIEIIQGPPLTVGGVRMKIKVFLEGALE